MSLVFGSIFFTLIVAELIVRDYHAGFQNLISKEGGNLLEHYFPGLYAYDSTLGWVPTANTSGEKWEGIKVHTLNDGIRSNGGIKPPDGNLVILAVGDSFTFGDQVADDQTWPAILEKMTGYKVLNAGVSSYGLDQAILRAEQLIPKYKPDVLIVSIIYDDIDRCRQNVRHGIPKPYFVVENNQLVLKNVPVPFKKGTKLDFFRTVFGHSHLVHKFMNRFFPTYWWQGTDQDYRYVKNGIDEVVTLLFGRLDNFAKDKIRVIVLLQGDINVSETRYRIFEYILGQLRPNIHHLEICNTTPSSLSLKKQNRQEFFSFFVDRSGHLSLKGNTFVATMLKHKISGQSTVEVK